jgi:hypothetical protein
MPYITQDQRLTIDELLSDGCTYVQTPGELNYLITTVIQGYLLGKPKVGYAQYNEVVGVLECLKLELYRRVIAEYENKKIKENGDVYGDVRQDRPPDREHGCSGPSPTSVAGA